MKKIKKIFLKNYKNNKGSITIEASISMMLFTFFMVCILSFISISRAQAAIATAVNQTTLELSQYAYFYKMSGLYDMESDLHEAASSAAGTVDEAVNNVDVAIAGLESIYSAVDSATGTVSGVEVGNINATYGALQDDYKQVGQGAASVSSAIDSLESQIGDVAQNPMGFVKSLLALGASGALDEAKSHLVAAPLAKAMCKKHLETETSTADERLRALGVINGLDGLNFKMSTMFSRKSHSDINIICVYQVRAFPWLNRDDYKLTFATSGSTMGWVGDTRSEKALAADTAPDAGGTGGTGGNGGTGGEISGGTGGGTGSSDLGFISGGGSGDPLGGETGSGEEPSGSAADSGGGAIGGGTGSSEESSSSESESSTEESSSEIEETTEAYLWEEKVAELIARHPKYKDEIEEIFSSEDNDFCIDAVLLIDKYGVTAIKTISEYGKDAITIGKEYEQEGLKFLDKYQEDGLGALKVLSKYNQRNPEILISDLKDAMDIDSKMSLRLINECGDDGLELVSMREGNLSEEIIEVYLSASRNNDSKTKVMLGLTGEYNERAGKDYSFFKTEDDSIWEHLKAVCGEDYDEIWKVNETYLKEQIAAKKEIFLTNDPNEDYLLPSGEKNFIRRNWIT